MSSLSSPVVATGANQSQIESARKPGKQAKTVAVGATGCRKDGKECHEEGPPAE